jgi:hypothetical protein
MGPEFTEHQINLLLGNVQPKNNKEWSFIQDHANDVIPGHEVPLSEPGPPMPPGIDDLPPIGFEGKLLKEPPLKRRGYDRGNYNADLTAPED